MSKPKPKQWDIDAESISTGAAIMDAQRTTLIKDAVGILREKEFGPEHFVKHLLKNPLSGHCFGDDKTAEAE